VLVLRVYVCVNARGRAYACVRVALHIQHTKRMRRMGIYGLWLQHIFLYFLINGTIFRKKKKVTEHKMYVSIFLHEVYLKYFLF
jgi:hypothetical protein